MSYKDDLRAYAAHVPDCSTCKKANTVAELCDVGRDLWLAIQRERERDPEAEGITFHCIRTANVALYEVIVRADDPAHPITMPLGLFCEKHWAAERAIYRAAGSRTGISIVADPWLCCWEPRT